MRLDRSSPVIKEDLSSEVSLCPHCDWITPPQLRNCVPNHSKPRLSSLGQDFSCGSLSTSIWGIFYCGKRLGFPFPRHRKLFSSWGPGTHRGSLREGGGRQEIPGILGFPSQARELIKAVTLSTAAAKKTPPDWVSLGKKN